MTRRVLLIAPVFALLAACHPAARADHTAKDARDIALVDRAQHMKAPPQPITLAPVSFADVDVPGSNLHLPHDIPKPHAGDGCGFLPANAVTGEPLLVAVPTMAIIKHDNAWEGFAADTGSEELPSGLHVAYASSAHTLQLTQGKSNAAPSASLTLRDSSERIVYFSAGELRCRK